jgi:hypothetical protein
MCPLQAKNRSFQVMGRGNRAAHCVRAFGEWA